MNNKIMLCAVVILTPIIIYTSDCTFDRLNSYIPKFEPKYTTPGYDTYPDAFETNETIKDVKIKNFYKLPSNCLVSDSLFCAPVPKITNSGRQRE